MLIVGADNAEDGTPAYQVKQRFETGSLGSSDDVNCLVLYDGKTGSGSGNEDSYVWYIRSGTGNSVNIPLNQVNSSWVNEVNTGSPYVVRDFVKYCMTNYPAHRYFLHFRTDGYPNIINPDQTNNDNLRHSELADALKEIKEFNNGTKIDIVGPTTCGTGMIGWVYTMAPFADYYVGSQHYSTGPSWHFEDYLDHMVTYPNATPEELVRFIVTDYTQNNQIYYNPKTVAAWNLSRFMDHTIEFNNFTKHLLRALPYNQSDIQSAMSSTWSMAYTSKDLYHFAQRIQSVTANLTLHSAAEKVKTTLVDTIVSQKSRTNGLLGDPVPHPNAHGEAIWRPNGYSGYLQQRLMQDTYWGDILQRWNTGGTGNAFGVSVTSGSQVIDSGATCTLTIHATDTADAPVSGATIDMKCYAGGSFSPFSGNTNSNGDFTTVYTAPQITPEVGLEELWIAASASRSGYYNGHGFTSVLVARFPEASVLSPNGGEVIGTDVIEGVNWTIEDGVAPFSIKVEYSLTGEHGPFHLIDEGLSDISSLQWDVPDVPSKECYLRVTAIDSFNIMTQDISNSAFEITYPLNVSMAYPDELVDLYVGDTVNITWTLHGISPPFEAVLDFSPDVAQTPYSMIFNSENNTGFFNWVVPDKPTSNGLLNITIIDDENRISFDITNESFTILRPPEVEVTHPNNISLSGGNAIDVIWSISDGRAPYYYDIYYSTDGGISFGSQKIKGGKQDVAGSGEYPWFAPELNSEEVILKIEVLDENDYPAENRSDRFTLDSEPPLVNITTPKTSALWRAGTYEIEWVSYDNFALDPESFEISFSQDRGDHFTSLGDLSTGSKTFNWSVPPDMNVIAGMLRVQAHDMAGNLGEANDTVITIDTTSPIFEFTPPCCSYVERNLPIEVVIWDNYDMLADNSTLWYKGSDVVAYTPLPLTATGEWNTFTTTIPVERVDLEYYIEAWDMAGNHNRTPIYNISVLPITSTLSGWVFDGDTLAPITNVEVSLLDTINEDDILVYRVSGNTQSVGGGEFKLEDVEPGSYMLSATKEGYTQLKEYKIDVLEGINQTGLELHLFSTQSIGSLKGIVVDINGRQVPGASVNVIDTTRAGQSICQGSSSWDGGFIFESLPAGSYRLNATKTGYMATTVDGVEIVQGVTTFVELLLLMEGEIPPYLGGVDGDGGGDGGGSGGIDGGGSGSGDGSGDGGGEGLNEGSQGQSKSEAGVTSSLNLILLIILIALLMVLFYVWRRDGGSSMDVNEGKHVDVYPYPPNDGTAVRPTDQLKGIGPGAPLERAQIGPNVQAVPLSAVEMQNLLPAAKEVSPNEGNEGWQENTPNAGEAEWDPYELQEAVVTWEGNEPQEAGVTREGNEPQGMVVTWEDNAPQTGPIAVGVSTSEPPTPSLPQSPSPEVGVDTGSEG